MYKLPDSHIKDAPLDFSFSGLKTAVINLAHNAEQKGEPLDKPSLAASFCRAMSESLVPRTMAAVRELGYDKLAVAGGVAANGRLRQLVNDGAQKLGAKVYLPELKFCGDNGAMIAAQGYYEFKDGNIADLTLNGLPTLAIDYR